MSLRVQLAVTALLSLTFLVCCVMIAAFSNSMKTDDLSFKALYFFTVVSMFGAPIMIVRTLRRLIGRGARR